jgi:hypothetical protein
MNKIRFTATFEYGGRNLARRLSGGGHAAKQLKFYNALCLHTGGPYVHACHDGGLSRADKLSSAAAITAKIRRKRLEWPYIHWPIGGDANRPDCLYPIAGPKVEAG